MRFVAKPSTSTPTIGKFVWALVLSFDPTTFPSLSVGFDQGSLGTSIPFVNAPPVLRCPVDGCGKPTPWGTVGGTGTFTMLLGDVGDPEPGAGVDLSPATQPFSVQGPMGAGQTARLTPVEIGGVTAGQTMSDFCAVDEDGIPAVLSGSDLAALLVHPYDAVNHRPVIGTDAVLPTSFVQLGGPSHLGTQVPGVARMSNAAPGAAGTHLLTRRGTDMVFAIASTVVNPQAVIVTVGSTTAFVGYDQLVLYSSQAGTAVITDVTSGQTWNIAFDAVNKMVIIPMNYAGGVTAAVAQLKCLHSVAGASVSGYLMCSHEY